MIKKSAKLWLIDSIKLFDALSSDQKIALQSIFKENHYSKNDYVFRHGDPMNEVYFINNGRVKIIKHSG